MAKDFGKPPDGPERQESAVAKAGRVFAEELKRRKWRAEDLAGLRKGERQKARIAMRLRRETPMTWFWLADKLAMEVGAYAAHSVGMEGIVILNIRD